VLSGWRAPGVRDARGLLDAHGIQEARGVRDAREMLDAPGLQEAPGVLEALSLGAAPGAQEVPGPPPASGQFAGDAVGHLDLLLKTVYWRRLDGCVLLLVAAVGLLASVHHFT
jgi:hypothetical protein